MPARRATVSFDLGCWRSRPDRVEISPEQLAEASAEAEVRPPPGVGGARHGITAALVWEHHFQKIAYG